MKKWKTSTLGDDHLEFAVSFASTEVTTMEEVYLYPILSFLAEFGGALGLFLGFSFLMLWDFVYYLFMLCYDGIKPLTK